MSTAHCSALIVTGINTGADAEPIEIAHQKAVEMLGLEWVSPLSAVTNKFHQSFAVFPSGSSNGREAFARHQEGLNRLVEHLLETELDYVRVGWSADETPVITASHDDRERLYLQPG